MFSPLPAPVAERWRTAGLGYAFSGSPNVWLAHLCANLGCSNLEFDYVFEEGKTSCPFSFSAQLVTKCFSVAQATFPDCLSCGHLEKWAPKESLRTERCWFESEGTAFPCFLKKTNQTKTQTKPNKHKTLPEIPHKTKQKTKPGHQLTGLAWVLWGIWMKFWLWKRLFLWFGTAQLQGCHWSCWGGLCAVQRVGLRGSAGTGSVSVLC